MYEFPPRKQCPTCKGKSYVPADMPDFARESQGHLKEIADRLGLDTSREPAEGVNDLFDALEGKLAENERLLAQIASANKALENCGLHPDHPVRKAMASVERNKEQRMKTFRDDMGHAFTLQRDVDGDVILSILESPDDIFPGASLEFTMPGNGGGRFSPVFTALVDCLNKPHPCEISPTGDG